MSIIIYNDGNRVVETINDRNNIEKRHAGMSVTVKDATGDPLFGGGLVNYVWDTTSTNWLPTYSSVKSDLTFTTEEKPVIGNIVTTDFIAKDGTIWGAKLIDSEGLIVGDAQVKAEGNVITLTGGPWVDHTLHYTYAHGNMTTELYGIWNSKAGVESPEFTGTPKAPTAIVTAEDEQLANTEFVANTLKSVGFEKQVGGEWKSELGTDTYTLNSPTPVMTSAGTIDLSSQQIAVFNGAVNQNIVLSNRPDSGRAMTVVIKFKGKGGTITWPSDILWADDKAPTLATTYTLVLLMWDGEEWIGSTSIKR